MRMKHLAWLGLYLASTLAIAAPATSQTLPSTWEFRLLPGTPQAASHTEATQWRPARVPGTVHTDLLANKLIPNPYIGAPEAGLQWIGLADWEYRTSFAVPRDALDDARSDLVFEGLDTIAEVYLNGEKVLDANNFFRTWRVPVQGRLRESGNELRVVFHSPIATLLPTVQAMPHKIAGNYPSPYGDEPTPTQEQIAKALAAQRITQLRKMVEAETKRRTAEQLGRDHVQMYGVPQLAENVEFLRASGEQLRQMRRVVAPLARTLATRLAARRRRSRAGEIDMRKTLRKSMSTGGVPIDVVLKKPHPARPELVVLCDVSGSVANFAQFTLLLVFALGAQLLWLMWAHPEARKPALLANAGAVVSATVRIARRAAVWSP